MEVMNRVELTQNDILVGNKSVTRSFGVSDDPMLMSMLSIGFYQNPLRTMIQEIMFNAWDAHHMGDCQHRPVPSVGGSRSMGILSLWFRLRKKNRSLNP